MYERPVPTPRSSSPFPLLSRPEMLHSMFRGGTVEVCVVTSVFPLMLGRCVCSGETEPSRGSLADITEKFVLEDELPLLVFFAALVGLVVLPADDILALSALDVAHNVATRRHVALARLPRFDIDNCVEEVGLAVLAAEILSSAPGLVSIQMPGVIGGGGVEQVPD